MTLFGKIMIIRTISVPKLLYPAHFLSTRPEIVRKANRMFFAFVWNSKDHIKRNTLIGDIYQGGLNMPDIESKIKALKATWVSKILNSSDKWSFLGKYYLISRIHNYKINFWKY